MSKNLFSIIIPTFNSFQTVVSCLESIVQQKYKNTEIIIIDGVSTDATIEILKDYSSRYPYIKWISEKDKGIYDAMNKGIDMAKGEWLLFLGSDDCLYTHDTLFNINEEIKRKPKSKIIYGDVLTSQNYIRRYENYTYLKLIEMNICHQSIFYHRSLFENIRYDLNYKIAADWDFALKVFKKENHPVYVPQIIVKFNLEGASNSFGNHPEFIQYFANKKTTILRYRSFLYLVYYLTMRRIGKIKKKLFKK